MSHEQRAAEIAKAVHAEVLALLQRGDNWSLTLHSSGSGGDVKLDVRRVAQLVRQAPKAGRTD